MIKSIEVNEISEGVFKLVGKKTGPKKIPHANGYLYRFMDSFYIMHEHLDEMPRDAVNNLCRARTLFPQLITATNDKVKTYFRALVERLNPTQLLEIGGGSHPLYAVAREGMNYVLADADSEVKANLNESNDFIEFSDSAPKLDSTDAQFDLIIAVFVLQFPFYPVQITEIRRCLAENGVLVANVYRRRPQARQALKAAFTLEGLVVISIADPQQLCRDHEYWIVGKSESRINECMATLQSIIESKLSL